MNWACRGSGGVLSTEATFPAHRLGPSSDASTTWKRTSQDTLVAKALASRHTTSGVRVSGNRSMRPNVRSHAHWSSSSCEGMSPLSTCSGRPARHLAALGVSTWSRTHRPAPAATSGCGSLSSVPAKAAASDGSQSSASSSSMRATGSASARPPHRATTSQAPSGDATWWPSPAVS